MSVLTDNKKFFPLQDPIYSILFTKMYRYPAMEKVKIAISDKVEKPEDIKTSQHTNNNVEEYNKCASCNKI
jgi:hypothetical protein